MKISNKGIIQKTAAYITCGDRLLVFSHVDFPEAGIQVPGGTVEEGEDHDQAVLREAYEETGLMGLRIASFLGIDKFPMPSPGGMDYEIHRHYYHLIYPGPGRDDRWITSEGNPSDGSPGPILLECFWVDFPDGIPELSGGMGNFLDRLPDDL